MCGYPYKGYVDNKGPNVLRIASKKALDARAQWMRGTGRIPRGEENRPASFRWTLSHEMAHQISFKIGLGYELQAVFGFNRPRKPSEAFNGWSKISDRIDDQCTELPSAPGGGWAQCAARRLCHELFILRRAGSLR